MLKKKAISNNTSTNCPPSKLYGVWDKWDKWTRKSKNRPTINVTSRVYKIFQNMKQKKKVSQNVDKTQAMQKTNHPKHSIGFDFSN